MGPKLGMPSSLTLLQNIGAISADRAGDEDSLGTSDSLIRVSWAVRNQLVAPPSKVSVAEYRRHQHPLAHRRDHRVQLWSRYRLHRTL